MRAVLITTLDFPVGRDDVVDATFDRPDAVAAAELCVWCPGAMLGRLAAASESIDGRRVPGPTASQRLLADVRRLRDAFGDLIARGGSLVVLASAGEATGGVHTLQEVVDFDPLEAVPGAPVRGRPLGARGGGAARPPAWERGQPFGAFFDAHGHRLAATCALDAPPGRTIARTADGAPIACFAYRHPGRLLVLPGPALGLDAASRGALLDGVAALVRRLDPSRRAAALPAWAGALSLPGETALRARVAALAQAAIDARRAHEAARVELARLDDARLLAAGDADAATTTLASLVVALGGVPHPEVDLPRALAFELDGRAALLAIAAVDDVDADALAERVRASVRDASRELGQRVAPILVDATQNARAPDAREPIAAVVARAAAGAGAAAAGSDALLRAWVARDAAALGALIDAAAARRHGWL